MSSLLKRPTKRRSGRRCRTTTSLNTRGTSPREPRGGRGAIIMSHKVDAIIARRQLEWLQGTDKAPEQAEEVEEARLGLRLGSARRWIPGCRKVVRRNMCMVVISKLPTHFQGSIMGYNTCCRLYMSTRPLGIGQQGSEGWATLQRCPLMPTCPGKGDCSWRCPARHCSRSSRSGLRGSQRRSLHTRTPAGGEDSLE